MRAWDLLSKKLLDICFQDLGLGLERNITNGPTCEMEQHLSVGPEATISFGAFEAQV